MARPFAKKFYSSRKWQKCRNAFMKSKHFICERCGGLAEICHHKVYLTPQNIHNDFISLNWDLLEAVCRDCHAQEHSGGRIIQAGLTFDEQGNVIPIQR